GREAVEGAGAERRRTEGWAIGPDRRGSVAWRSGPDNRQREDRARGAKPFGISKREVWEAYKKVKANQGAAGIDGQSIQQFESRFANNPCKPWSRMASGADHP